MPRYVENRLTVLYTFIGHVDADLRTFASSILICLQGRRPDGFSLYNCCVTSEKRQQTLSLQAILFPSFSVNLEIKEVKLWIILFVVCLLFGTAVVDVAFIHSS